MIARSSRDRALTAREIKLTATAIASLQLKDGSIPWEKGRHADPWNHLEAAMGLDVAGFQDTARRAIEWLAAVQRADGSWPMTYVGGQIENESADTNFTAYIAAAAWLHFQLTADLAFLRGIWPSVRAAIDFVVRQQGHRGEIWWAVDSSGRPWKSALLTASSSVHLSLGAALAIAERLGEEKPAWRVARRRLGAAILSRPALFEPRDRYAMDWYYPVLSGALPPARAQERLSRRWRTFVVAGRGVRCVSDRPWVTVAETCELAISLATVGWRRQAFELFDHTRRMREDDGSYWTGLTFPDDVCWPEERTTWTAGAVLLAAAAIEGQSAIGQLFRLADPAQNPEAAGSIRLDVGLRRKGAPIDLVGRPATSRRIGKDVMDRQ